MMTTASFITFSIDGVEPEFGAPEPGRIISGDPHFRTWNLEKREGGLYSGIWEATPGKWRIVYEEWEYFSLLAGHSIVTEEGGEPVHLKAGDRMILRPGFKGTWEVVETTRKDYVIKV
ncbi:cupin domain-containing protein [Rhizobium leguminosarum]|uniref:cupin domain-containing protein n=1 Tax=Rhizobium leguminosarum TaxID=384 RepID=UPI00102FD583|nr:cupin domain-containing protein [Rhizobium leguminosarum]TAU88292.1 cupin domain-containing protein [Rhizobium leguminosarum]